MGGRELNQRIRMELLLIYSIGKKEEIEKEKKRGKREHSKWHFENKSTFDIDGETSFARRGNLLRYWEALMLPWWLRFSPKSKASGCPGTGGEE